MLTLGSCGQNFYATMPSNIQALTGSCLVIPCSFTSPQVGSNPVGIWRINHYWYGTNVFTGSQPAANWSGLKVTILGDLKLRNCTTLLEWIGPDNQGVFYFRIEDTYLYQRNPFRYSSPNRPLLTPGGPVMEGMVTSLNCTAPLPCPNQPPSLMWSEALNGTVLWTVLTGINGSLSVSSLLTFTASYRDHQKNITCTAWYPVGSENRSTAASVTLSIWFPPTNTTARLSPTGDIKDGDQVALICNSSANPAANYTWFRANGAAISPAGSGQTLTLTAVTPGDSGRYYCQAENQFGEDNSSVTTLDSLNSERCFYVSKTSLCVCVCVCVCARPLLTKKRNIHQL
uniref:Ig-like domain-containing protein n=1 Tax=Erpetoichthys calabaricus TaxID=27687 RepID=A0A8C4XFS4_ERPCA